MRMVHGAQDGHFDSHTVPELSMKVWVKKIGTMAPSINNTVEATQCRRPSGTHVNMKRVRHGLKKSSVSIQTILFLYMLA